MQAARPSAPPNLVGMVAMFCLSVSCGASCRCRSMGCAVPLCGLPVRPLPAHASGREAGQENGRRRPPGRNGPCAAAQRTLRQVLEYSAGSTRVFSAAYDSVPAHALSRFPVRAEEEKWMPAKSFSPRCSPFSAESINFAQHYPKRPCSSMDRTTVS